MLIDVYERHVSAATAERELVLTHEQRSRGRLRVPQGDGVEVRLFLERGEPLQLGEYLRGTAGEILRVTGAEEDVATAVCEDWLNFSKACYHLGNRHVKIQIGERWLRIAQDHVLEDMLLGLGLAVKHERAVFDPQAGAYAQGHTHHDEHHHSVPTSLLLRHAHHQH